jgi:hypothetical protein
MLIAAARNWQGNDWQRNGKSDFIYSPENHSLDSVGLVHDSAALWLRIHRSA